jgi:hypothetical protein
LLSQYLSTFDLPPLLLLPLLTIYLSSPHHICLYISLPYHLLSSPRPPPPRLDAIRCLRSSGELIPPHSQAPDTSPAPSPRSGSRCHLDPLLFVRLIFFSHREWSTGFFGALFRACWSLGICCHLLAREGSDLTSSGYSRFSSNAASLIERVFFAPARFLDFAEWECRLACKLLGQPLDDVDAFLSSCGKYSLVGMVNCLVALA